MNQKLKEKTMEALAAVVPITGIVLLLSLTLAPMPVGSLLLFLGGAGLLILGVGLFSLGADMAMLPIGDSIGGQLSRSQSLLTAVPICFVIGAVVTIAEPDLQVLAHQVPAVPDLTLILTVAAGVGAFLVVALLRTRLGLPLNTLLMVGYGGLFALALLVPKQFLAVAFDSGGVTTGPITVPFLMAMGMGLTALGPGRASEEDSFGLVALCSMGPILAVMLLGLYHGEGPLQYTPFAIPDLETTADVGACFAAGFPTYLREVAIGLLPIIGCFFAFQVLALRLPRRKVGKIAVGLLYTYGGLVLFLTGVNVGFMPAGHYLGAQIAGLSCRWILIPIGMVVGWFIVAAEPAVRILGRQVEDLTGGAVSQRMMGRALSVGMAAALGLAMLRVLTGLSLMWLLVPGYLLALGLSFRVPKVFTAIAFDSGGVASGPMTATFLLPFAMGACQAAGGDVLLDAFGVVAMVAMTPLIAVQVMGMVYTRRARRAAQAQSWFAPGEADVILSYEDDEEVAAL